MGIASMRQFQCVHTKYVFTINELFTINFIVSVKCKEQVVIKFVMPFHDNNRLLILVF